MDNIRCLLIKFDVFENPKGESETQPPIFKISTRYHLDTSFSLDNLRFIDSLNFLNSSLDKLVESMTQMNEILDGDIDMITEKLSKVKIPKKISFGRKR